MFLAFEQVEADGTVKTVADLTIPNNATHAEIQSDTQAVRYTMDDATDPTIAMGMIFLTTEPPRPFLIQDVSRIRFIRSINQGTGNLNISYFAGRDI